MPSRPIDNALIWLAFAHPATDRNEATLPYWEKLAQRSNKFACHRCVDARSSARKWQRSAIKWRRPAPFDAD
jgi:hypothetical protein